MGDIIGGIVSLVVLLAIVGLIIRAIIRARRRQDEKQVNVDFDVGLTEQGFNIDKKVVFENSALYIDSEKKLWCVKTSNKASSAPIYKFSDLLEFNVQDDGETVVSKNTTGMIIGTLMFGVVGAIVGGGKEEVDTCTSLELNIKVSDTASPDIKIIFISSPTERNSNAYYDEAVEAAQGMAASLAYVQDIPQQAMSDSADYENEPELTEPGQSDDLESEMRQLEKQKADGTISEVQYNIKRAELLRRI